MGKLDNIKKEAFLNTLWGKAVKWVFNEKGTYTQMQIRIVFVHHFKKDEFDVHLSNQICGLQ